MSPREPKKVKPSLFSFSCGCRDTKSVSGSVLISKSSYRRPMEMSSSSGDTLTTSSSSMPEMDPDHDEKNEGSITFSALLRELNDLEQGVKACGINHPFPGETSADPVCRRRHRRSRSEGRVYESVAVVKDSADPLGDFRQSMLQMIVEKEIVGGYELRELLRRFLALNSTRYHETILRAFREIWTEVFSGYESTPDLLNTPDMPGRSLSQRILLRPRQY